MNPYTAGGPPQYNPNLTNQDPGDWANWSRQDRQSWYDRGNRLDLDYQEELMRRRFLEDYYRNRALGAYEQLEGTPGYTDEEQGRISREGDLDRLEMTPEEYAANYLNWDEQEDIRGDPRMAANYFRPDIYGADLQEGANRTRGRVDDWATAGRGAWGSMAGNTRGYIQGADLAPSRGYTGAQDALMGGYAGRMRGDLGNYDAATGRYLGNYERGMFGDLDTYDQQAGKYLGGYAGAMREGLDRYTGERDAALEGGEGAVRGYTRDPGLNVSDEYMQNFRFGPEDEARMGIRAAQSIGDRLRADRQRVQQAAAQSGYQNPLVLAGALENLNTQGGIDAENAKNDALIAARRLALDTTQQREGTRLGAKQFQTGQGSQAELALQRARLGAVGERAQLNLAGEQPLLNAGLGSAQARAGLGQSGMGTLLQGGLGTAGERVGYGQAGEGRLLTSGLGAAGEREGFRQGGELARMREGVGNEQFLGSQAIGQEANLGNAYLNTEENIARRRQNQNQFEATTGIDLARGIDDRMSQRAFDLARNRQAAEQYNQGQRYGRGLTRNQTLAQRYQQIADARRQGQQEWRGYLTGAEGQQGAAAAAARQGRTGLFGTQGQLVNQATQQAQNFDVRSRMVPGFSSAFRTSLGSSLGSGLGSLASRGAGDLSQWARRGLGTPKEGNV